MFVLCHLLRYAEKMGKGITFYDFKGDSTSLSLPKIKSFLR